MTATDERWTSPTAFHTANPTIEEWLANAKGGYTFEQLEAAFDAVKPVGNWKLPIRQHVPANVTSITRDQIRVAIDWYAGGGATFTDHDDGSYTVEAPGYYEQVGA